jgi:hypothetical protein
MLCKTPLDRKRSLQIVIQVTHQCAGRRRQQRPPSPEGTLVRENELSARPGASRPIRKSPTKYMAHRYGGLHEPSAREGFQEGFKPAPYPVGSAKVSPRHRRCALNAEPNYRGHKGHRSVPVVTREVSNSPPSVPAHCARKHVTAPLDSRARVVAVCWQSEERAGGRVRRTRHRAHRSSVTPLGLRAGIPTSCPPSCARR